MFNSVLRAGPSYTRWGISQLWQETMDSEFQSRRKREVTV